MRKGDISNKTAPAIAIDIDDLVVETPKPQEEKGVWGWIKDKLTESESVAKIEVKRYEVTDIYLYLADLFRKDITVYLLAHRTESYREPLENLLEGVPYNKLYIVDRVRREQILRRDNVKYYFYSRDEHASFMSGDINRKVESWKEIAW